MSGIGRILLSMIQNTIWKYNALFLTQLSSLIRAEPLSYMPKDLPFKLNDYIDLVEWTGRQINPNKQSAIPQNTPAIIERLNFDKKH